MSKDSNNRSGSGSRSGWGFGTGPSGSGAGRGRSQERSRSGSSFGRPDGNRAGSSSDRPQGGDRGGYSQDRGRSGGSYDRPQGGDRGGYAQDRGRSGGSYDRPQGGDRGGYAQDRGRSGGSYDRPQGGDRGGYSQDRGRSGGSYDRPQGGDRGGYAQDRGRSGGSYDRPQGGDRGGYSQDRGRSGGSYDRPQGGDRGGYAQDRSQDRGRGGYERGQDGNRPGGYDRPQQSYNRPRQPFSAVRLEQVTRVLGEVLQWTYPADAVLSHWFRANPGLGGRDRAEVAEGVYDVLRNLRRYRQLSESGVGNAVRRLAILGLAATRGTDWLKEALDSGEAGWLDRVDKIDPATMPRAVRLSMPDWLFERLSTLEDSDALMASLNQTAHLDIRVNPLKGERDALLAALNEGPGARFSPVPMPHSPWGIRFKGHPPVNRYPQFEDGTLEVQDEGSQLLALLVGPRRGEMIIDFCAGAGGKSLLIGALMRSTGRLYAFDVSAARLARAKPRFARSGLSNVVPVAIESENDARVKRLAGKAQRVFVDAPCSGIGTLRRNPDLKWRQQPQALAEMVELQARILKSASRCVAPGGRLVYATCSLLEEENAAQAARFLAENPEFEQLDAARILNDRCPTLNLTGPYVQLRPDQHGTDGFFAAVFERKKPARANPDANTGEAVGGGSSLSASNEDAPARKSRGADEAAPAAAESAPQAGAEGAAANASGDAGGGDSGGGSDGD